MIPLWIGSAISGVTSLFTANADLKKAKAEGRVEIEKARIASKVSEFTRTAQIVGDYDLEAQKQMKNSIKDEILMIILFLPFIAGFMPHDDIQNAITAGWAMLATAPSWYPFILIGIVCSVFGLRWYASKIPAIVKKDP